MEHHNALISSTENQQNNMPEQSQKPYTKPVILHELRLETRAGSSIGPSGGLDMMSFLRPYDPRPKV